MFHKLVANLPFSPALVGQLGFYAKRLKKEEATRRLGLVFTALALVVQSFAILTPPDAANASNPSDMIHGGVGSVREVLDVYDQSARGKGDFKVIMDYAGVTRSELSNLKSGSVNSRQSGTGSSAVLSWGRVHRLSSSEGEVKHVISDPKGGSTTIYSRPIWRYDSTSYTKKYGSTYPAYVGHSKKIGWFAIMKDCGNLMTVRVPDAPLPKPEPKPEPEPVPEPKPVIKPQGYVESTEGKSVANLTKNIGDANNSSVRAGDRLEYTLYAKNTGTLPATVSFEDSLLDVMEYASLQHSGGGIFDDKNKTLSWGNVEIGPGEREERKFVVQLASEIPATPRGVSEPGSYDCQLNNAFGNSTVVEVDCPTAKVVERTVSELPKAGAGTNVIFGAVLLIVVTYFYSRSRQTGKEIRLIRRDFNSGTI
jgi:uncharacterized repeat protein (TIGR01451 family)